MSGSGLGIRAALAGSARTTVVVVAVGLALGLVTGAVLSPAPAVEPNVRSGGSSAPATPRTASAGQCGERGSVFLIAVNTTDATGGTNLTDAKALEEILRPVIREDLPFKTNVIEGQEPHLLEQAR